MKLPEYIHNMWHGIHMMCKTYGYNKDVKYLEAFIFSCFLILPESCSDYIETAKKWINRNDLSRDYPSKYALEDPNSGLFSWSVDLHVYLDTRYTKKSDEKMIDLDELKCSYNVDGLFKDIWGPVIWKIIHLAPLIIENTQNIKFKSYVYKALVSSLQNVIPCPVCRMHLKKHLPKIPIDKYIHSPMGLFMWSVSIHNKVNLSLKKKVYTVDDALRLYNKC